jgi:hypothetical protein
VTTSGSERRKFLRIDGFLDGAFQSDDGVNGLAMLTNFSREGLGVSLNREVRRGAELDLDIRFPGGCLAIPAKGKVVWLQHRDNSWRYGFEAGVKLEEIDRWDRARLLDYAYEQWRQSKAITKEKAEQPA